MSDMPRQIVRALEPGEFTPFYSTAELLLGVRHVVHRPSTAYDENEMRFLEARRNAAEKSAETQRRLGEERFKRYAPKIKVMLEQALSNKEMAVKLEISERAVDRLIGKSPELIALSAKRKIIRAEMLAEKRRAYAAKGHETSTRQAAEKFTLGVVEMKSLMEQAFTNKEIAAKMGISFRQVSVYIANSPELKAASKERFDKRKGSFRKLEQIRGKLVEMQAAGEKGPAIAKALGMNKGNVWKYMKMIEQENKNAQENNIGLIA